MPTSARAPTTTLGGAPCASANGSGCAERKSAIVVQNALKATNVSAPSAHQLAVACGRDRRGASLKTKGHGDREDGGSGGGDEEDRAPSDQRLERTRDDASAQDSDDLPALRDPDNAPPCTRVRQRSDVGDEDLRDDGREAEGEARDAERGRVRRDRAQDLSDEHDTEQDEDEPARIDRVAERDECEDPQSIAELRRRGDRAERRRACVEIPPDRREERLRIIVVGDGDRARDGDDRLCARCKRRAFSDGVHTRSQDTSLLAFGLLCPCN
jgi:hypothetical protein